MRAADPVPPAAAVQLRPHLVAKPWGRRDLAPWLPNRRDDGEPIGELWFKGAADDELLVKLLFTSARLSVQVHPDDAAAQAVGLRRGKDEAWVVLGASPEAEIAVGLRDISGLAAAARDGSIIARLEWRRVAVGDALYSPAGTVHAIGGGLTLLEVQQNADVTYRLFDYGSTRRLDLEAGLVVARAGVAEAATRALAPGHRLLASGAKLQVERLTASAALHLDPSATGKLWVFVAAGTGQIGAISVGAGECIAVDRACAATCDDGDWIVAYARSAPAPWLLP